MERSEMGERRSRIAVRSIRATTAHDSGETAEPPGKLEVDQTAGAWNQGGQNHGPILTFLDIFLARSDRPRIEGWKVRISGRSTMIAHFRTASAGAAIAALTVAASTIAASAQTIKIGLINSYSGFLAQAGDQMQKGIDLYVKEHEKDLPPGVKIEIINRDDAAAPEVVKRAAQDLISHHIYQYL